VTACQPRMRCSCWRMLRRPTVSACGRGCGDWLRPASFAGRPARRVAGWPGMSLGPGMSRRTGSVSLPGRGLTWLRSRLGPGARDSKELPACLFPSHERSASTGTGTRLVLPAPRRRTWRAGREVPRGHLLVSCCQAPGAASGDASEDFRAGNSRDGAGSRLRGACREGARQARPVARQLADMCRGSADG